MRLGDSESFYRYFHMTPQRFSHLLSLVVPYIQRQDTRFRQAIPPDERLAITLRYLVTGDSMQTISFSYRVGYSTVSGIIDSTCDALWNVLLPQCVHVKAHYSYMSRPTTRTCQGPLLVHVKAHYSYMSRPTTPSVWRRVGQGFEQVWNFPHCVGAIDGKHIVVQAPACSGSTFF